MLKPFEQYGSPYGHGFDLNVEFVFDLIGQFGDNTKVMFIRQGAGTTSQIGADAGKVNVSGSDPVDLRTVSNTCSGITPSLKSPVSTIKRILWEQFMAMAVWLSCSTTVISELKLVPKC